MRYYFDYNATCPMLDVALDALCETAKHASGNPSSMHGDGRAARRALDDARDVIAKYINAEPSSLIFTSGGTEANNMAIFGVLAEAEKGNVVVSAIEHPSVLQTIQYWSTHFGHTLKTIRPDRQGLIDVDKFCDALDEHTVFASMMWANNESGVIQPVHDMVKACRERHIPCLVDAVQALGKIDIDVKTLDADFVSFSAHKIGGAKGVGALAIRRGSPLKPWLLGGGQERGRRSGTESVPAIAAFAAALGVIDYAQCSEVRDDFEAYLKSKMPDVTIHGNQIERVGNTSMFTVPGMDGETLLMQLDLAGFSVASGSACSSGKREPSHVLKAMGVDDRAARSSLRVSFGLEHSKKDAHALVDELIRIRALLRKMAGR
ncbi:MAG: cysteine desulfurase family protein [Mariprofundaceae bacterium]|nr:cysteine desulfurase family protein [Mariprofundaceae bacterium]